MTHSHTFTQEYLDFCIEKAHDANKLHYRLVKKLRCKEVMAALKARAIMFVQVTQPIRVAVNSKKYAGGQDPSQLDVAPFWCRAYDESIKLRDDPSCLFNRDYNIFAGMNNAIAESISKFRKQQKVAEQLNSLLGKLI